MCLFKCTLADTDKKQFKIKLDMKNKSKKQVEKIDESDTKLLLSDVSKSFYCSNEKKWLDRCEEQCMSCAVEMIRTKVQ